MVFDITKKILHKAPSTFCALATMVTGFYVGGMVNSIHALSSHDENMLLSAAILGNGLINVIEHSRINPVINIITRGDFKGRFSRWDGYISNNPGDPFYETLMGMAVGLTCYVTPYAIAMGLQVLDKH
jgi:hypothetical protein